jgi:antitoxin component of MazEF toxin-antitoxin module
MTNKFEGMVDYDEFTDDLVISIPDKVFELAGLKEGDTIVWSVDGNSVTIKKKEVPKRLYAVEEIISFRCVHFVEASSVDEAEKYVLESDNPQYFQKHLSSNISSVYAINREEMAQIIQETEQPDSSTEELMSARWDKNIGKA